MANFTNEQKARLFDALHADGVDNWEGYKQTHYREVEAEIEAENFFLENKKILEPLFQIIETNIEVSYPVGREAGAMTALTDDGISEIIDFISKNFTLGTNQ